MDWFLIITTLIKIVVVVFLAILPSVAYSVYFERRVSAWIQDRLGPNRVGPMGLLQPIADGLKFLLKEDVTPGHVNKFYFWLAPALVLVPALVTCAVLPFGSEMQLPGWLQDLIGTRANVPMVIADLDTGPLFIFAISSLGVYGIVLAGWASNSKYPFLGGVRSSSQMISYEIALGLSIIPLLMIYGDLHLGKIVAAQAREGWSLLPFWTEGKAFSFEWKKVALAIPVGISFIVFMTAIFAETNRVPFDLAECETELVGGYHTEYSSMKFALFFLGEYAAMIVGSCFAVTLFFGGWTLPFGFSAQQLGAVGPGVALLQFLTLFIKVFLFVLFFIWVRWTLPRFRYDQLMKLGWVWLFEIALVNIILTAGLLIAFR
ncbi:MAG: NADH-quinone oxidoreductase subunit H [Verrucomicrobia bacterium]|jgi:NADH-quinone oxidoreductase subunit H|nr:MAG: NADH-quinone oxidoreductase subunit H [Verrucomicrobiota bacterium]